MINYRGAIIEPGVYGEYAWHHPDHSDASWDGDGWETFGMGCGRTLEECKEAIDDMFEMMRERI
jgi:hypothetical protein